jgi:hypothetical protein
MKASFKVIFIIIPIFVGARLLTRESEDEIGTKTKLVLMKLNKQKETP